MPGYDNNLLLEALFDFSHADPPILFSIEPSTAGDNSGEDQSDIKCNRFA